MKEENRVGFGLPDYTPATPRTGPDVCFHLHTYPPNPLFTCNPPTPSILTHAHLHTHTPFREARWSTRRDPSLQLCNPRGRLRICVLIAHITCVCVHLNVKPASTGGRVGALGWLAFQKRIDHLFCPPDLLEFLLSVSPPFPPRERGGG